MARMFPEIFPRAIDQADPEYLVYEVLKRLPDPYAVFYSKRFKGTHLGKAECEIDFTIFNQRDALICLEVKGGVLSYDGAQDRWLQNGKVMSKGPDRQATEATHCLLRNLEEELKNVNVDWALCFPQCTLASADAPTGIPLTHIIDERGLTNIHAEISRIEKEARGIFKKHGVNAQGANDFVKRMTRNLGFVETLGVRIARESSQLLEVTEEQFEVLADLEINRLVLVHGAAGTGKTVLAQEFAKRLEADGKSVLLLFYNKGIAANVRGAFQRLSKVQVATFASFAKRLIERVDADWWPRQTDKSPDFWELFLPSKLLELEKQQQPEFDAIIVDEGQDFKPEWFEYLLGLLRPGPESRFCVFLDEHQDIFHHWHHFPSPFPPTKKLLVKNCRNTRAIVDHLKKSYPVQMGYFERSPAGTPCHCPECQE